ncbi:insulinoma-associated protein 1a-like [Gigantopelta aegis]|uniref:insulinoma-associated protein 1a-like n=1 Tax=Gigantopelta aegis TaxID=1735272 RepID=UPI001B88A126|nr:insulinoma-associated protein 1a-like [Gigantopelta aegis]
MPRGFLVKRSRTSAYSYREKRHSDDDRLSDSGSEHELVYTSFGSPDSGYSASPISLTFRDSERYVALDRYNNNVPVSSSNVLHNGSSSSHPQSSPLYFSAFDRLTLCTDNSPLKVPQVPDNLNQSRSSTPNSPRKRGSVEPERKTLSTKKPKAARKINFDIDKTSPVSGTIIKDFSDSEDDGARIVCGDIEPVYNCVEVTPEARAELDKIENKIGDYICQLCKEIYQDAFQLAQHRCSRIVHVEYRCPECDKVFNCPANLASHRRWHKPKQTSANKPSAPAKILPADQNANEHNDMNNINSLEHATRMTNDDGKHVVTPLSPSSADNKVPPNEDGQYHCETCGKKFRRHAYLRKHVLSHTSETPLPCQFCAKIFLNETARAKHEAQHGSENKELACNVCSVKFPNKGVLDKHVRTHNKDVYTCKYCSSTFYSSPGLTRHINKCHPSENRQVILLQLPVTRPC